MFAAEKAEQIVPLTSARVVGTIISVLADKGIAFIDRNAVTLTSGADAGIKTSKDIFVRVAECQFDVRKGVQVSFEMIMDEARGGDAIRAKNIREIRDVSILPPKSHVLPGFAQSKALAKVDQGEEKSLTKTELASVFSITPVYAQVKEIPASEIRKAIANHPMPGIPRGEAVIVPVHDEDKELILKALLRETFPVLAQFGCTFAIIDPDDTELDKLVAKAAEDTLALGLNRETVDRLKQEVEDLKASRKALKWVLDNNLVRPDTVFPIDPYFQHFFLPVPVMYQCKSRNRWGEGRDSEELKFFCDLFPDNERWRNLFQLFNSKTRTLSDYPQHGDLVPPEHARLMREASEVFDYVCLMTCYHSELEEEWQKVEWVRLPDPYIVAFNKRLRAFFVIGRFSDDPWEKGYPEMLSDTMAFIRANKHVLTHLDSDNGEERMVQWYDGKDSRIHASRFGSELIGMLNQMLRAFNHGMLFEWLSEGKKAPGAFSTSLSWLKNLFRREED